MSKIICAALAALMMAGGTVYAMLPEAAAVAQEKSVVVDENNEFVPNEFDITLFGANGDDEIDDTDYIQNALDMVESDSAKQQTVHIPRGVYYISRCLTIHSNTSLILDDGAKIIRTDESQAMLKNADDSGALVGGYGHAKNITVSGGEWDGNVKNRESAKALFLFNHSQNINILNTSIHDYCGGHGVIFNACSDVEISGVELSDFVKCKNMEQGGSAWYQEAMHFDYASEEQDYEGSAAPLDNTGCRNVHVDSCKFEDLPVAVGTHHDYSALYGDNITFNNCEFKDIKFACINAYGFRTMEIKGNKASNCLTFANLRKCQGDVSNNSVSLVSKATKSQLAGVSKGYQMRVIDCTLNISGNKFVGGASSGLVISENSNIEMSQNKIKNVKNFGMKISDSSRVAMSSDLVSGSGETGIGVVDGSVLTIKNAKILNNKQDGIKGSFAKKITLKNCTIKSNARGIAVNGGIVNCTSGKICRNAGKEIVCAAGTKGTFRSNTFGGGGNTIATGSNIKITGSKYLLDESSLKLDKKIYKFKGKAIKPKVTVTFAGKTLSSKNYKITYSANKKRGKGTVTVIGKGAYVGKLTAKFTIK